MLEKHSQQSPHFDVESGPVAPYRVASPVVEVLDEMSIRVLATFCGPTNSRVIGRAWISDADGTLVDGCTDEIDAGTTHEMVLTIPEAKVQNGDLIACIRVEWPLYQTKHVVQATLVPGEIVHPPASERCE